MSADKISSFRNPRRMRGYENASRACDLCKRRKARCYRIGTNDTRCVTCTATSANCTFTEAAKKPPNKRYLERLEARLANAHKLLCLLMSSDIDLDKFENECDRTNGDLLTALSNALSTSSSNSLQYDQALPLPIATKAVNRSFWRLCDLDTDYSEPVTSEIGYKYLLDHRRNTRYFGESSGFVFTHTAMDMKRGLIGFDEGAQTTECRKRPEFWKFTHWIPTSDETSKRHYHFPDRDLLHSLVSLYFTNSNIFYPLLHRPTFESSLADGLHFHDDQFGAIVLLVCAIGSRFSDDARIARQGPTSSEWFWFHQVGFLRRPLYYPVSLYGIQSLSLSAIFLERTAPSRALWNLIGIGLRAVQDAGIHRRKAGHVRPLVEGELWNRAFWVLFTLDHSASSMLGRPCALRDDSFDNELPAECDDVYWSDSDREESFKQPLGKPSSVSFFTCLLKLKHIVGAALRTTYYTKSKCRKQRHSAFSEQRTVAEIDSALNKWIDSLPEHLRWDPEREDMLFFRQSAVLHAHYYKLQLVVHRLYIRMAAPLSPKSVSICKIATRSCNSLIEVTRRRTGLNEPQLIQPAFACGVVQLILLWAERFSRHSVEAPMEMEEVQRFLRFLHDSEDRWSLAGQLWLKPFSALLPVFFNASSRDILNALTCTEAPSTPPLPEQFPKQSSHGDVGRDCSPQEGAKILSVTKSKSPRTSERLPNALDVVFFPACQHTAVDHGLDHMSPLATEGESFPLHPPLDHSSISRLEASTCGEQQSIHMLPSDWYMFNDPFASSQSTDVENDMFVAIPTTTCPLLDSGSQREQVQGASEGEPESIVHDAAVAMLTSVPTGLDWEDWSNYVDQINQNPLRYGTL